MKKTLTNSTIIISLLVVVCLLLAFKKTERNYEHMFIITRHEDLAFVWISTNKGRTQLKNLKKESQGDYDLSPLINEIERYQADGWELQSASPTGDIYVYWLRREK